MPNHRLLFARKAISAVVLLVFGSVAAFGLGELFVRLVAPQQLILLRPDIWRPLDSLGWAQRPDVRTQVNTGDRTVTLVTDSSGFRIAESGRPPGQYRILLLGDSFMEALQVEYGQSVPGLIERCFEARTGSTAAVWNTGVGGWDPPQYYLQARRALAAMPFDLVLVSVFLGNDIVSRRQILRPREPDPRRTFRFPRKLTWGEFIDAVLAPINDGLETRSQLFIFLKNRLQGVLMKVGLTALEVPSELRRDQAESSRWALTGDMLAEIDSVAGKYHTPTLFFLIPSIEEVEPSVFKARTRAFGIDSLALDIDQPDRIMAAQLQQRGLEEVSLLAPLREAQMRGVVLYGRADPHPSADGHRVMWNAIAPAIAQELGLPYNANAQSSPDCAMP